MTTITNVVHSADGTPIAWSRMGRGPAIVMIGAVMASRDRTPQPGLPAALAEHHAVFTYDRRGTGASGDTPTYAAEREYEDLQAMLTLAGPDASVYGFSSGATLALLAASHGVDVARLLLLEPPLVSDPTHAPRHEAERRLALDRADARRWFDEEIVGIPAEVRATFPPLTEADLANAPAMLHELTFLPGTTANRFADVTAPALLLASDHTAPDLIRSVNDLGATLPNATVRLLPGQWHGVPDDVLVAAIEEYLDASASGTHTSDKPA